MLIDIFRGPRMLATGGTIHSLHGNLRVTTLVFARTCHCRTWTHYPFMAMPWITLSFNLSYTLKPLQAINSMNNQVICE